MAQQRVMQKIFILLLTMIVGVANGQSLQPSSQFQRLQNVSINDSTVHNKWSVSKYSGLSASFVSFRGGSAFMYAAPMGLQVNRMLNKNLYAFAGVEITPAYISLNQPFGQNNSIKNGFSNSFMQGGRNQFSINPSAFVGLGYTNDEHTFQIQARMNISQGNYYNNPAGFSNFYQMNRQMNPLLPR